MPPGRPVTGPVLVAAAAAEPEHIDHHIPRSGHQLPAFGSRGSIICAIRNASTHESTDGPLRLNARATLTVSETGPPSINCVQSVRSRLTERRTPARPFTVLSAKLVNA